jgi:DNA-binding response OmpR family regulator
VGDLVLKPATYDVSRAGKEIALNRTEFRLLKFSMRRSGWVVSRKRLSHTAWDSKGREEDNLLDVTISHLRRKVDRNHKVKLIRTVRNVGYSVRGPGKYFSNKNAD